MKTFKTRHQFYLPDGLAEQLEAAAAKPGSSKTAILTDALTAFFERRAGHELDLRFGVRLDRLSRGQERHERQLAILSEAFGLFVQFQLTQVAHQPPADQETGMLGLKRYRAFIDQVGRRIAGSEAGVRLTAIGDENDG
jgi:predicted transcriptional regulator